MISISNVGDWIKTEKFLHDLKKTDYEKILSKCGEKGVAALKEKTPKRTGKTSESWNYEIRKIKEGFEICWYNTNVNNGENIALLIQMGHGTSRGVYVKGRDYINPALKPVFDDLANDIFEEVSNR